MSTAVVRKLIVRVETQTDGYDQGMKRVREGTQDTSRHIEQQGRHAEGLAHKLLKVAEAALVARKAYTIYNAGTRLLGNDGFTAAKGIARSRAIGIGGTTAVGMLGLGFSPTSATLGGAAAARTALAINSATLAAKAYTRAAITMSARSIIAGTALQGFALGTTFLLGCAEAAEQLDAKLKRIPQTIQSSAPTIGDAFQEMRTSFGREFNNSIFGDVRKSAQRFGRDVGLMGTGIKDWIISGIHGFSDRAAGRDRTQGDLDRYREKNFELLEAMKARKRIEDSWGQAQAHNDEILRNHILMLREKLALVREGEGAYRALIAAQAGASKADQLAIRYATSIASAREKEFRLDDRLRSDLKRNREGTASAGKSARNRELAARQAEGLDPEQIDRLRASMKAADATTATNSIRDQIDALKQQAATFGMSADAAERWNAKQKGANAALIEQHRLLSNQARARVAAETKRRTLASGAAATIEANMTPAERLAAREAELARQKRAGHLTDDQFDRATKAARRDFYSAQPDVPGRPAALERGSAAAFHASFGADRKQALDADQLAQAKESVKLLRRQLDALKTIADGSETAVVQNF